MRLHDLLRRGVRKKLKDRGGEALAEVLIALAIAAVGMVLLAGMIMSSADLVNRSKNAVNEYVGAQNDLAQQGSSNLVGSVAFSRTVVLDGTETTASFVLTDEWMEVGGDPILIPVRYYINDKLGRKDVVAYRAGRTGE